MRIDGSGRVQLVASMPVLRPDEQVLQMMLDGWRNQQLSRNEQWIDAKLDGLPDEVRQPVQHFATWHHLRRIRAKAASGAATRGPVHSAKQEITETVKFLIWLHETYERTAATCTQQDVDEWLATGPTTRSAIRTFFVIAKRARLNTTVTIQHRTAKASPSLSQDQLLAWIHELLTGTSESLPYRVAGMLLLLYAQPLVKVVALPTSVVDDADSGMSIRLGTYPTDLPEPFASLIREHAPSRPNLRSGAGPNSPWLFPSTLAGRHLHPNTVMCRLRDLGVNLLGARNRAISELVLECPPLARRESTRLQHAGRLPPCRQGCRTLGPLLRPLHQALSDVRAEMMATVRPSPRTGDTPLPSWRAWAALDSGFDLMPRVGCFPGSS
ncbi:MAG: hypothetical protein Q4P07_00120 [Ornithinimicrobium sp.]|uniref:hypothetical protein n=1 Tax=Ornithinimicrobium sp. TaxID=1977084 RepID=UPI0026E06162|nr:hypothetical protein [Ornithinimicrobium sp.]MDO5738534.1 hypothetical protein [Ornithinimicrobium sp.]